jgi:hypothetical protein
MGTVGTRARHGEKPKDFSHKKIELVTDKASWEQILM